MKKVSVYIDGFNLFHALDHKYSGKFNFLKWLDIKKLILKNFVNLTVEELVDIFFFSAKPEHLLLSTQETHIAYTEALKSTGVKCINGNFKKKQVNCENFHKNNKLGKCVCSNCSGILFKNEEKESDVNLALYILRDAYEKISDRIIVITNDSDISPAIRMARTVNPMLKIMILTPPLWTNLLTGKKSTPNWDLLESAGQINRNKKNQTYRDTREIKEIHITGSLFPKNIIDDKGEVIVIRPSKYDPPI